MPGKLQSVCSIGWTENKRQQNLGMTPTVNLNLDISSREGVNMMVDSGAQVSLVGTDVLRPETKIDTSRKVKITSIHGTEETLGEVGAKIMYKDLQIPVNFQVMKTSPVQEDGILGFDVLHYIPTRL